MTHSPKAAVEMRGVSKFFGAFQALNAIDLTVAEGERIVICGPSGSGKSTLIRTINQLETIQQGTIKVDGTELTAGGDNVAKVRREVGMVFQQFNLFPHLTVLRNCMLAPLKTGRATKAEAEATARKYLERVKIPEQADKYPAQLSGGQQQRVALARALVNRPKLLLLDEPLGALDLKLRKQMQIELKRIQSEVGITFLYVTHDQEEAIVMSDRLAVMSNGKIEQVGPPDQVYDRPATEFVAGFLGASNMMWGEVHAESGAMLAVRLEDGVEIAVPKSAAEGHGKRLRLGVRPEKIAVLPMSEPE